MSAAIEGRSASLQERRSSMFCCENVADSSRPTNQRAPSGSPQPRNMLAKRKLSRCKAPEHRSRLWFEKVGCPFTGRLTRRHR